MPQHKTSSCLRLKLLAELSLLGFILIFSISGCSGKKENTESDVEKRELNKLFEMASIKADSENVSRGMQFIDSAVAKKELDIRQKFKVLGFKSAVYFYRKDTANTMIYVDSMLNIVEQNGKEKYPEEYAIANYSKGDVLFYEKRYPEAYNYYFTARYVGKGSVDLCTLSEYSYRIGMVLFQQARFIEAAENFKDAFKQSEKCSDDFAGFYRRQELLNNTGLSYLKAGIHDSALIYCNKALGYLKEYDGKFKGKEDFNDIARGVIYETEGEIFKEQRSYAQAKKWLKASIAINTKKGYDNKNAQLAQLNLAEVYFLTNNTDSMSLMLQGVRQSIDSIGNKQVEIDWNRLMSKYSESKNEIAKAFNYLETYTSLQDSANSAKNKLTAYDITNQIRMLEDQYKINSLQKENKLKSLYLVIFLIATALGTAIFLFSLYILKNTRKNFKILKSLNGKIEDQKVALQLTLSHLEDRNQEKDRILRAVAHDLRNPVASISMLAELIMDETNENARTEMLKLIKTSSENSITLISEILESAGTELKSELQKERVDINVVLEDALGPLYLKAGKKQQTIQLELSSENQEVLINKEKMQRVISNLVTNAIKFSPSNSAIKAKTLNKKDSVEILIQDSGIGIPDDLKSKVFDMFTEAKRPGTAGEKPFGLGLSICRQIVEAHGGTICFESEEGKGTTFFVKLNHN